MKRVLDFARHFLIAPSRAADECDRPSALADGLKIYAALAVAELVSSWFDPLAFLDKTAPIRPPHTGAFWLVVAFWEPILMAMSVFFTVLTLEWMSEGWLPLKTAAATLWSAIPVAIVVYYTASGAQLSHAWAVALLAVWVVPAVWLSRRITAQRWRRVGVFLLGMSAIQLVGIVFEFLVVVPAHSLNAFYAYSLVMLVWVVACFGIGMRRMKITSSVARAVLAFVFALLVSAVVPSLAYLLGLMPQEVLKVVLYV